MLTGHRCEEELPKTEKEMVWTTRYFMHQRDLWYQRLINVRAIGITQKGYDAYCEDKMWHWEEFARLAAFQFQKVNPNFPSVWVPIITPQ